MTASRAFPAFPVTGSVQPGLVRHGGDKDSGHGKRDRDPKVHRGHGRVVRQSPAHAFARGRLRQSRCCRR